MISSQIVLYTRNNNYSRKKQYPVTDLCISTGYCFLFGIKGIKQNFYCAAPSVAVSVDVAAAAADPTGGVVLT